jgi:hypothetical protein
MSLEKLLAENQKQRSELLIQKAIVKEHNVKTLAFIIEELYHSHFCSDIVLRVLIQQEDFGSLFSKPKLLVKPKNHPDLWLVKDENWFMEAVSEEQKIKRVYETDVLTKELVIPENIFNLIHEGSIIVDNYEWDHFRNIGTMERSSFWKSYQDEEQKDTKERVWIASLSEVNYIETLSSMCPQYQINPMSLKEMLIEKKKDRLDKELLENPHVTKRANKI